MLNLIFTKMKKRILPILMMMVVVLFTATNVFADDETFVSVGFEGTYNVSLGNGNNTGVTYAWSILEGSNGTEWTATFGNTNENDITWNVAGTYTIQVIATDGDGCLSEPLELEVIVSNAQLCIADGSTTVAGSTPAAPTGTTTCSLVDAGNGNSSSSPDETVFIATVTGGLANHDYDITYSVGSTSVVHSTALTTDGSGEGTVTITVAQSDYVSDFTNDTASDDTVTIAVVSMDDENGFTITNLCTESSYDVTVHPTPTISF